MRRLPITLRLTVAFAAAMLLVLLSAALFVALRLRSDLDDQISNNLWARNAAALNAYREGTNLAAVAVEDPEESFVQLLEDSGTVLQTAGDVIGPAVLPAEVRRALHEALVVERSLPGIDGPARMPVTLIAVDGRQLAIVTGQSLLDRNEALSSVLNSFLWGGVTSLVLASAVGLSRVATFAAQSRRALMWRSQLSILKPAIWRLSRSRLPDSTCMASNFGWLPRQPRTPEWPVKLRRWSGSGRGSLYMEIRLERSMTDSLPCVAQAIVVTFRLQLTMPPGWLRW